MIIGTALIRQGSYFWRGALQICHAVQDLWALTEFDETHRLWGVRFMFIAIGTNILAIAIGFLRIAQAKKLLNSDLVSQHVWEHAVIAAVSITNLDNLNLLAWKDGPSKFCRTFLTIERPLHWAPCTATARILIPSLSALQ